jgi:hypothetical protein
MAFQDLQAVTAKAAEDGAASSGKKKKKGGDEGGVDLNEMAWNTERSNYATQTAEMTQTVAGLRADIDVMQATIDGLQATLAAGADAGGGGGGGVGDSTLSFSRGDFMSSAAEAGGGGGGAAVAASMTSDAVGWVTTPAALDTMLAQNTQFRTGLAELID